MQWIAESRGVDSRAIDSRNRRWRRNESLFRDLVRIGAGIDTLEILLLYPVNATHWNDRGTDNWRIIRGPRPLDLGILFQLHFLRTGLAYHSIRC